MCALTDRFNIDLLEINDTNAKYDGRELLKLGAGVSRTTFKLDTNRVIKISDIEESDDQIREIQNIRTLKRSPFKDHILDISRAYEKDGLYVAVQEMGIGMLVADCNLLVVTEYKELRTRIEEYMVDAMGRADCDLDLHTENACWSRRRGLQIFDLGFSLA